MLIDFYSQSPYVHRLFGMLSFYADTLLKSFPNALHIPCHKSAFYHKCPEECQVTLASPVPGAVSDRTVNSVFTVAICLKVTNFVAASVV